MDSFKSEEGADFSDALEDFSALACESESVSTCSHKSRSSVDEMELVANILSYDFWAKEPIISVDERRDEFVRHTGLDLERWRSAREQIGDVPHELVYIRTPEELSQDEVESKAITVRTEETDVGESSSKTPKLGRSVSNAKELVKADSLLRRRTTSDVEMLKKSCIAASPSLHTEEISKVLGIPNWVQQHFRKRDLVDAEHLDYLRNKDRKDSWLKRLSFKSSSNSFSKERRHEGSDAVGSSSSKPVNRGVSVTPRKKQWKELSGLYVGQDFSGHEGYIMSMKFSPDGKRLATGCQDGVVRVWMVAQDQKSNELDVLAFDQSSLYVSANGIANMDSFHKKDEGSVMRKLKKLPDKACMIAPKKFFKIRETSLHDFHEHEGDVLDISWSEKGTLLSASVDKTVRLWQLGQDRSIRVFPHRNFVTCVQFNPEDHNLFISGSIDGIVRIWSIPQLKVVHWIDIKEIVTAICYRPGGEVQYQQLTVIFPSNFGFIGSFSLLQGAIVGTILGNCHFYDITDNHLHLGSTICLEGKKSPGRRINSFQFSQCDPSNVIITSGDSQVRIFSGLGLVCKLRGLRSGRKHMSASFTADGKYIVSASADSNVYIWNCSSTSGSNSCYRTNEIKACESFISENALIAIPWHGYRARPSNQQTHTFSAKEFESLSSRLSAIVMPAVGEGHAKLFKELCQRMVHSEMWGLVIVTGGSDGRIRAYHNYGLPVHA